MAVNPVQPLEINIPLKEVILSKSVRVPVDMYAINNTGITISFAGKPAIKAISMKPSRPIAFPIGSRKFAI